MKKINILENDWRKEHPASIQVCPSITDLAEAVALRFLKLAFSTQETGIFSVIMGGGRTPRVINQSIVEFSRAGSIKIDWRRVYIYFSDERCVPPDHSDSNYKLILETFIQPLAIPLANVRRIKGEADAGKAAEDYHRKLSLLTPVESHGFPVFDLAVLGMGLDGHTASLFPHANALKEANRCAVPAGAGPGGWNRITVTLPVFNAAKNVWLIAAGVEKSPVVEQLINGSYNPIQWPVQAIFPANGNLIYWLDAAASP
ncbi:MAG: 6-phosphogluconolactonase [Candidatus Aminicenantes bacterium]|nr:6-phosphogluconolactonase [Candidatus Aminicenantes bacterium]